MPVDVVLLGGFLGAGKTTTIIAMARRWISQGKRVVVIANDQAADLVDTQSFRSAGLMANEVAGGCFCCRFDDFVTRADELIERTSPDIILAEPVGSCTDLVATVLNPLDRLYPGRFRVSPYSVLLDPIRGLEVLDPAKKVGLPGRVTYIFRTQQQEADIIGVSKIDLLSADQRDRIERLVGQRFSGTDVVLFSAKSGEGLETLESALWQRRTRRRALRDIDYDTYAAGEAELGWLNSRLSLEARGPLDIDATLIDLARRIEAALRDCASPPAHAKLALRSSESLAVANVVGTSGVELSQSTGVAGTTMELTANLRVQASPDVLQQQLQGALLAWTEGHKLFITAGTGQAFSPGRPVPTHRMAD
jgi:G3E family GTPase